ncbi:hypothetical protein [Streptomyces sp. NPDC059874]|uniref:DUF7824 domain-containing protein n=1 Tax=Streptomyces sp. NPDC059874 TaxID=3346983 RepID=UPI0036632053
MIEGEYAAPSPGALADEVAAVLADRRDPGVETFERLLSAVVVHAYRDREALAAALGSVPREFAVRPNRRVACLAGIVGAAVEPVRAEESWENAGAGWLELCQHVALDYIAGARVDELQARLRAGDPVPFPLSAPSGPTGAVEPRHLVERLAEYARLGVRPGPADLGQALLRCGGPVDAEAVRAAEKLDSAEGPRVADWLRQGGLPQRAGWRERESGAPERPSRRRGARAGRRILVGHQAIEGRGAFPRQFWSLFRKFEPAISCPHWSLPDFRDAHTVAALPWHPEIAAARLLTGVASAADQDGGRGAPAFLEALAAADGPAGPAVHLAVAYGLASAPEEDREAAVRALLLLAARGRLDGELLGRELAELVGLGTLKVALVTESLRAAATAPQGAAPVWAVLAAGLPGLLAATRPHAHGALLAVAADSARLSGARGELPEVTALAQRPGSSRLLKEARRLRDALAGL